MRHRLLSFDTATRTGWAFESLGPSGSTLRHSGFFDLPVKGGWAHKLTAFTGHIDDLLAQWEPDVVAIEKPQRFRNADAARVAYSLYQIVKERWKPRKLADVNGSTLKKWATGSGKAEKPEMTKAAGARWGVTVTDHNEADAILVACYARERMGL